MKSRADPPLRQQISSTASIVFAAFVSGLAVLGASILLQWIIYIDWLHRPGIRLVGSVLAGVVTGIFAYLWQCAMRERRAEMLRRLETISRMNDRIRNALQIIECATYATNPEATEPVRDAVDVIEGVLQEVLVETHPALPEANGKKRA
jgi:phosphate/sulfate permease